MAASVAFRQPGLLSTVLNHNFKKTVLTLSRTLTSSKGTGSWHFKNINPYSQLYLSSSEPSVHVIQPIDPVKYPNQNEANIRASKPDCLHCEKNGDDISVKHNVHMNDSPLSCEYLLPIKFGINCELSDTSTAYIKGFETDRIHVMSSQGPCHLDNIKCDMLQISSQGSVISQSVIHANGSIETQGKGNIYIKKALGTKIELHSESGDICVDSAYVDETDITTETGNVNLGAAHRNLKVRINQQGNLSIGTLDGNLRARVKSGDVSVHISQHENCDIHVEKGNITLQLPDTLTTEVQLDANQVNLDDKLNKEDLSFTSGEGRTLCKGILKGSEDPRSTETEHRTLKAVCKEGSITLQCKDWFSTLKLGDSSA